MFRQQWFFNLNRERYLAYPKYFSILAIFFAFWSVLSPPGHGQAKLQSNTPAYGRINISKLSAGELQTLKSQPQLEWWVEADQQLLVLSTQQALQAFKLRFDLQILDVPVQADKVRVIAMDHFRGLGDLDAWLLMDGGRFSVVQARSPLPSYFFHNEHSHAHVLKHTPLVPNTVLAEQWRQPATKRMTGPDPLIQSLVNKIDASRWLTAVYCLASYNRFSRGAEIREAEAWLVNEFSKIPGITVRTEAFTFGGTEAFNVIAELPGDGTTDDIYVIGAHYDSISENTNVAAPGAEDNASGTAAVLEMAHVLATRPPAAKIIFACYSGEEQGLHGSRDQVNRFAAANQLGNIKAALIMDMIGYSGDDDLDTLLETRAAWSDLADTFAEAAATYSKLRIVTSFNPFGSDHVPFLQNNVPALLVIENDWNIYPGYHRTNDLPTEIRLAQGHENLKMNVATMALLFGYAFQGNFVDYLTQWNSPPNPPATQDLNDNMLVDITELLHIINTQP